MDDLKLINASEVSFEFIRGLRNNPENAHAFVNNEFISPESHTKYMFEHLGEYFVCFKRQIPVGFIGVVDNDIRLAVCKEYRNQGIAKFMVSEIMLRFPQAIAKIKVTNEASVALFESLGFTKNFYVYQRDHF
jgi:GNAT superfamily N-acetyltransferase